MNYLAILLAAVSTMLVGSLWYSKALFGARWQELVKLSKKSMKAGMGEAMMWSFIGALVMATVLSMLLNAFGATNMWSALHVSFLAWLGFVLVTNASSMLYEQRSKELFWINMGYHLVSILVMGVILVSF